MAEVTELKSASRVHKGEWTDSGIPFFRSSDVMAAINGTTNEKTYISEELYEKLSSASGKLDEGDVLVTGGGSVGNPYIVPNNEPLYTKDADLLWIKNQGRFHPYYLYEYFFSPTFRTYLSSISHVGTIAHYTITQLSETPIYFPNIEEQIKVGEYFDSLDHLITLHQKKCFEWKKIGFSSASISWEQRKLGDIYIERNERGNTELDILSVSIHHGISKNELASDELGKSVRRSDDKSLYKHVYYGDLVFNMMRAWQGAIGVARNEGMVSPAYISAIPNGSIFPEYMDYCLRRKCIINQINNLSYGVTDFRKRLYWEPFTRVTIMMPSVDEQRKITDVLSRLDHLITLHQRKLELLKRLRNSLIDRCFIGEKYTMSKKILYHGSPNRVIVPKFGFGEDRHDYGRGFYLTENLELAKEWAVCRPDETNGWVHKYELEMEGLNILDFQKYDVLSWLAELMKHRDAADSRRYKMLAQKFIEKYGIDTCGYDVITGWRANASYFYIAKEFVRDNIDIEILEELLSLGGLGIQFCIKSERAFAQLSEVEQDIMSVDYSEFNDRYNERDINARNKMRALVDSDANKVTQVFSTLFER